MTPKVSIIVPCYNVEQYLERGIGSLSRQTLGDIEIICVNDASTDGTLRLLETLALMDMRITVINLKKNGGVSNARNTGINKAKGEYIGFLDPDDMVDFDFCQKLYDAAKKDETDMAVANLKCHKFHLIDKKIVEYVETNPKWRPIEFIASNLFFFTGHYAAIYRRKFLKENKLEYPTELSNGEDHIFEKRCILALHCKHGRYTVVPQTFYHHIRRLGSLDSCFFNMRQLSANLDAVKMALEMLNNAPGVSERDYNLFIVPRVSYLFTGLLERVTSQKSFELIAETLVNMYKNMKYHGELSKNIPDATMFALLAAENTEQLAKHLAIIVKYIVRKYKLFGFINIMTTGERYNCKTYWLFGRIKLWQIKL